MLRQATFARSGASLTVVGRDTVSGESTETAVGLDGNHTNIAMLQTPDGNGRLEIAASHGCHPLRGVATYEDIYKLAYVRGPSGITVMLAEQLKKS